MTSEDKNDNLPMADIFSIFETDAASEENGKWFEHSSGVHFKIRRANSKAVSALNNRLRMQNRRFLVKGEFPESVQISITCRTIAGAILVDWKNVIDSEGNEIPFDAEKAYELLVRLPALRDTIYAYSAVMENFKKENEESALGN